MNCSPSVEDFGTPIVEIMGVMAKNTKKMKEKKMMCSICCKPVDVLRDPKTEEILWKYGHNAAPVNKGRCCSKCNETVVLPERVLRIN